jgi:hypothetical protein
MMRGNDEGERLEGTMRGYCTRATHPFHSSLPLIGLGEDDEGSGERER